MWFAKFSEDELSRIRLLKRRYWAQKGMAKEYIYCAYKPEPITRMKNLAEFRFVMRHAIGPRILDAGTGTGRFAMPLRQAGHAVAALDISLDMLGVGQQRAQKSGIPFAALAGDIERLPFADATFDSIVSVTVLRHFPHWPTILAEYLRVVRPGGRIIFDMASGEQRAYMKAHNMVEIEEHPFFDPVSYDAALTVKELEALAKAHKLRILAATPYDFFNENALLDHLLGEAKNAFKDRVRAVLEQDMAVGLYEALARRFLAALSPAVAGQYFIVLEKAPNEAPAYRPAFRGAQAPENGTPEERLHAVLAQCLGAEFESACAEAAAFLDDVAARRFLAFCRDEVLPLFPVEAACYEAP